jgi:hypothetical protein
MHSERKRPGCGGVDACVSGRGLFLSGAGCLLAALAVGCAAGTDHAGSTGSVGAGTSAPPPSALPPSDDAGGGMGSGSGSGGQDAGSDDAAPLADDAGPACTATFPPVTDFGARGPITVTQDNATTIASLGTAACTIFRPTTLGQGGVLHPVIIWGNGTGTPTEIVYEWLFNQWASHGFIVAAANTPNAGTGVEMLTCLDWVESQSTLSGSPYEGKVLVGRAGSSGHSQGGGGSIMVGRDPRIVVTVPFMAYTVGLGYVPAAATEQHGPMLLMSGSDDTIAVPSENQAPVFASTNVPTLWGTLAGANHVTFALGGYPAYLGPSTAWFRLNLMCDQTARPMFYGTGCTMCTDTEWTVQKKGIP